MCKNVVQWQLKLPSYTVRANYNIAPPHCHVTIIVVCTYYYVNYMNINAIFPWIEIFSCKPYNSICLSIVYSNAT